MPHFLSIAIASRRATAPLEPEVVERLKSMCGVREPGGVGRVRGGEGGGPLVATATGVVTVWPIGPAEVVAALELVGRHEHLVAAVWLSLPTQREIATKRAIIRARKAQFGVVVARGPASPLTTVTESLFALHIAVLRGRTPAQWRTIDARRKVRTANEAAVALGCTHQTVSRSLDRAGLATTRQTRSALIALLELASTPS